MTAAKPATMACPHGRCGNVMPYAEPICGAVPHCDKCWRPVDVTAAYYADFLARRGKAAATGGAKASRLPLTAQRVWPSLRKAGLAKSRRVGESLRWVSVETDRSGDGVVVKGVASDGDAVGDRDVVSGVLAAMGCRVEPRASEFEGRWSLVATMPGPVDASKLVVRGSEAW